MEMITSVIGGIFKYLVISFLLGMAVGSLWVYSEMRDPIERSNNGI